jgi:hypothetical protein
MNSDTKVRLIGVGGLAIIAVWLTLSIGNALYLCLETRRWPLVSVHVISSGIDIARSNMGRRWLPDVRYEYEVAGLRYQSTTIRFLLPSFMDEDDARLIQSAYPQDAHATAAYDPQAPARSVLEPGVPANMWGQAAILVFFWTLTAYVFYEIKHPERRFLVPKSPEHRA